MVKVAEPGREAMDEELVTYRVLAASQISSQIGEIFSQRFSSEVLEGMKDEIKEMVRSYNNKFRRQIYRYDPANVKNIIVRIRLNIFIADETGRMVDHLKIDYFNRTYSEVHEFTRVIFDSGIGAGADNLKDDISNFLDVRNAELLSREFCYPIKKSIMSTVKQHYPLVESDGNMFETAGEIFLTAVVEYQVLDRQDDIYDSLAFSFTRMA